MKKDEHSMDKNVDLVLQKYGIIRVANHGEDLNGAGILIVMDKSNEIVTSMIKTIIIDSLSENPQRTKIPKEILEICDDHKDLWDGAFSQVQTIDPSEYNFNEAQISVTHNICI